MGFAYIGEGKFSDELLPKEDHACNPEEEDVMARLQQTARVEHVQLFCLWQGEYSTCEW